MPIYEYRCGACGHELDILQKLNDKPLTDCPECTASQLKRLISAPNFRLKGSGWYETDFKSEADTKRNLADKADAHSASEGKGDQPKSDVAGAKADTKRDAADKAKPKAKSEGAASKTASVDKAKPKPGATDSAT